MEWQTIDSAPRDGAEILGYREDAGVFLCRWDAPENFLSESECEKVGDSAEEYSWMFADFVQGDRLEGDMEPTHWLPLPNPPQATPAAPTPIHPTHGASEGQETTIARQFYRDKA